MLGKDGATEDVETLAIGSSLIDDGTCRLAGGFRAGNNLFGGLATLNTVGTAFHSNEFLAELQN